MRVVAKPDARGRDAVGFYPGSPVEGTHDDSTPGTVAALHEEVAGLEPAPEGPRRNKRGSRRPANSAEVEVEWVSWRRLGPEVALPDPRSRIMVLAPA